MSGRTVLIALLCCAIGCSTSRRGELTTSAPGPDRLPQSVRLVAVTEAPAFALLPRIVDSDRIVIPLPAERGHLASVEVALLVTRRDTGEIMDQQRDFFDWNTRGEALRFFLPNLPDGDYIAQIRTTSTILSEDSTRQLEIQLPDQAQISFHSNNRSQSPQSQAQLPSQDQVSFQSNSHSQSPQIYKFEYHFEVHPVLGDTPALISEEIAASDLRLKTVLKNNTIVKVTLDCWASSDGDPRYNMLVSQKRCAWVRENALQRAQDHGPPIQPIEAAHGEDNLPIQEPAGIAGKEQQDIQKKNRVVILKVYTSD